MKIDYYSSPTCGPCKVMWPKVKSYFADASYFSSEDNPELFKEKQIVSVPTIIVDDSTRLVGTHQIMDFLIGRAKHGHI